MKWEVLQPERGKLRLRPPTAIVDFARENGMPVRGHTLVWHIQNPAWLEQAGGSRDECIAMLREHIRAVDGALPRAGRASGTSSTRRSPTTGELRDTRLAARDRARVHRHGVPLRARGGPGRAPVLQRLRRRGRRRRPRRHARCCGGLRQRGVPVDGVGLQGHVDRSRCPGCARRSPATRALGLDIAFTEVDVRMRAAPPSASTRAGRPVRARSGAPASRCRAAAGSSSGASATPRLVDAEALPRRGRRRCCSTPTCAPSPPTLPCAARCAPAVSDGRSSTTTSPRPTRTSPRTASTTCCRWRRAGSSDHVRGRCSSRSARRRGRSSPTASRDARARVRSARAAQLGCRPAVGRGWPIESYSLRAARGARREDAGRLREYSLAPSAAASGEGTTCARSKRRRVLGLPRGRARRRRGARRARRSDR